MVLLFGYWWVAGTTALVGGLLFALVFWKYSDTIVTEQRKVMVSYATAESNFFDTVQGAEVIKGNNKEEFFTRYTKEIYATFQTSAYNLALLGNNIGLKVQFIGTAAIIGVIAFSSYAVLNNILSLGALVAVLSLAGSVLSSSASLSAAYITLQEAKVAYDRLYEFVSIDQEQSQSDSSQVCSSDRQTTNIIETLKVENVNFRFPGRPLLLKNISFEAKKGQLTAIVGEIGSGKSTLLNLISRFYEPESGKITTDGQLWTDFPLYEWRTNIGIMSQHIKLFNSSLLENICLTNDKETMNRCQSFCMQLDMRKYFGNLPLGPLTRVGEDGINISGGQRQLAGLYRSLFSDPRILLLDEPTNNMDKAAVQFIWDLIEREKHNRICILVTHNEQLAAKADTVVHLT